MTRTFLRAIAALGVATALAACGWDGGGESTPAASGPAATAPGTGATDPQPVASTPDTGIPASAFGSAVAFVGYLKSLLASESDEPLALDPSATPPVDDTGGPVPLS